MKPLLIMLAATAALALAAPPAPATAATTATIQKICAAPDGSTVLVPYSTACPAGTRTAGKLCPGGQVVSYSTACPVSPVPGPSTPTGAGGAWKAAPLVLAAGGYARATTQCGAFTGAPVAAGTVVYVIARAIGVSSWPDARPRAMVAALPIDSSRAPVATVAAAYLYRDCLEGVAPA